MKCIIQLISRKYWKYLTAILVKCYPWPQFLYMVRRFALYHITSAWAEVNSYLKMRWIFQATQIHPPSSTHPSHLQSPASFPFPLRSLTACNPQHHPCSPHNPQLHPFPAPINPNPQPPSNPPLPTISPCTPGVQSSNLTFPRPGEDWGAPVRRKTYVTV